MPGSPPLLNSNEVRKYVNLRPLVSLRLKTWSTDGGGEDGEMGTADGRIKLERCSRWERLMEKTAFMEGVS